MKRKNQGEKKCEQKIKNRMKSLIFRRNPIEARSHQPVIVFPFSLSLCFLFFSIQETRSSSQGHSRLFRKVKNKQGKKGGARKIFFFFYFFDGQPRRRRRRRTPSTSTSAFDRRRRRRRTTTTTPRRHPRLRRGRRGRLCSCHLGSLRRQAPPAPHPRPPLLGRDRRPSAGLPGLARAGADFFEARRVPERRHEHL